MSLAWFDPSFVFHPQSPRMQLEFPFSPSQPQTCWSNRNRGSENFCRTVCRGQATSRRGCCRVQQGPDPGRHPHRAGSVWRPRKQRARSPRTPRALRPPTPPLWAEVSPKGRTSSSSRTALHLQPPPARSAYQPPSCWLWKSWEPRGRGFRRKTPTLWRERGVTAVRSTPGWRRISPHPRVHNHACVYQMHVLSVCIWLFRPPYTSVDNAA